jgi:hypothetical protein
MIAPFSSPNFVRERLGRLRFATSARKQLCFAANRLQFTRWGSADRPSGLPRCASGFSHQGRQTESEKIPNPAKFRCYCNDPVASISRCVLAIFLPRLRSPQPIEIDKQILTKSQTNHALDVRLRTPLFDSEH